MTIQEMNERRKELGYTYEKLAELSGVPLGTLQKVLGGITKAPRYETLRALESVLEMRETLVIRECLAAYGNKKPGDYTIDDYFALPDEQRVELIDGVLYNMAAPTFMHQTIAAEIFAKLREFIRKKKGSCIPGMSPIDVQLDRDHRTMVQPDVLVICDRNKLVNGRVYGVPDFIVEVLSPSSVKIDTGLKEYKYERAGVREYWVVDPKRKRVVVYTMNEDEYYDIALYTFQDEIPVYIFQNECKINFER